MTMDEFRKMRGMIEPETKPEQPRRGRKPKEQEAPVETEQEESETAESGKE
jgi:hypothetical protein